MMSMTKNICWSVFLLALPWLLPAQTSVDTLSLDEYYDLLRDNHPVARQAALLPEQAIAQLRLVRGAYDPKLFGEVDQKVFEGKNYYRHLDGGLKIMTLPGIEVKAGYEQGIGENLNPEAYTPSEGLMYAGISVPLGQGLLIDSRRAALRKARIFQQSSSVEQLALLNDLFLEATKVYWEWSQTRSVLAVQEEAVAIAEQRYNATVESFRFGDKPGVDTLEALIQLQTRQQGLLSSQLEEQKARLMVSNYLWNPDGQPLIIDQSLTPNSVPLASPQEAAIFDSTVTWLNGLAQRHPEMQLLRFKLAELEVERRLKADKLKPKVYVNYNLINRPVLIGDDPAPLYPNILENNYKWGLSIGFPIFLREERGNLELARLKIQDTEYKQDLKLQELTNKVLAYLAELENLTAQLELYEQTVGNYEALLEAEVFKFEAGESSLFLINSRETKLIEARIKLLELQAKFRKTAAGLAWSAGVLAG